jgi:hypothetical protein
MNEDKLNIISTTVHYERVKKKITRKEDNKYTVLERNLWVIHQAKFHPCLHINDMA